MGLIRPFLLGLLLCSFVVIGIIGAIASGGGSNDKADTSTPAKAPTNTAPDKAEASSKPKPKPAPTAPVKITAKKTAFSRSILADGSDYTSVLVTVTNNSGKEIDVNPLYFTITDTNGTKHSAELAAPNAQVVCLCARRSSARAASLSSAAQEAWSRRRSEALPPAG
ncbi:hypothetical protein [Streptomyces sp. NPDC055692]|uniref:hypothetical protein n=1 Tax=Streptomyces sp. NPDC055692 TaxID=3155683 RepID=UPI00341A5A9A